MPRYKLTYFAIQGLGEPIRLMLSYLKEDFEDVRIKSESWNSMKPSMPFGKVPILEFDGKRLHQSTAICRYLGKQAKIAGKNDEEALQIDIAVDTIHDFRSAVAAFFYEPNNEVKAQKKKVVMSETAPFYLSKLDEMVEANNGYLANGALSWGDIYFIGISVYLNFLLEFDIFEKYQNLAKLRDNVQSIPEIKAWIEKRPKTVW